MAPSLVLESSARGAHAAAASISRRQRSLSSHVVQTACLRASVPGPRGALVMASMADGASTSYGSHLRSSHREAALRRGVTSAAAGNGALSVDKVGVVIVDHGSRKKASNEMLGDFGRLYGEITGQEIVEIAHMEIAEPTIEQAVGRCAERGATKVVIAPYFLSRGRHIQEDIPALVKEAQVLHPGLTCVIAEPIGIDSLMVQLISNRVAAAAAALADGKAAEAMAAGSN